MSATIPDGWTVEQLRRRFYAYRNELAGDPETWGIQCLADGMCPRCCGPAFWPEGAEEPICTPDDGTEPCTPDEMIAQLIGAPSRRRIVLRRASMIVPEPVRWLWTGRLPLRGLSLIAGEAGLGKSTMTIDLAARVSRGELDGELLGQPRDVLIATAEDHWGSVVLGRLTAAQADMHRVHQITVQNPEEGGEGLLTLPDDVAEIDAACADLAATGNPPALIVIDPVSAYIGSGVDTHKDASVRRVLAPLAKVAEEHQISILGVAHLNKSQAEKLLDRVGGSVAFGAAPRSVLAFARDPEDPAGERGARRVILHAKSNHGAYAPTLAAHIEEFHVPVVGGVSRLIIDGRTEIGPEDLRVVSREERTETEDAKEWLVGELADGDWHQSAEIKARAAREGISQKVLRRARERLGVEIGRAGFAGPGSTQSAWRLPLVPSDDAAGGHERAGHEHESSMFTGDSAVSTARSCPSPKEGTSGPGEGAVPATAEEEALFDQLAAKYPELA